MVLCLSSLSWITEVQCYNAGRRLGQRLRCWPSILPTLSQHSLLIGFKWAAKVKSSFRIWPCSDLGPSPHGQRPSHKVNDCLSLKFSGSCPVRHVNKESTVVDHESTASTTSMGVVCAAVASADSCCC